MKNTVANCEVAVLAGTYRWIDPKDKLKGCIAVHRLVSREHDRQNLAETWIVMQSGYAGPLVLQLPSTS